MNNNKNNWRGLPINPCACGCGAMVAKKFSKGHGRRRPLLIRFMGKVEKTETCWLWRGAINPGGYGRIGEGSMVLQAHRVAYKLLVGPIPEGLHIDHLCGVRHCVRPDHLEAVTQAENNRRANARRWRRVALLTGERP